MKRKCELCNKPLVPIHNKRLNGDSDRKDWDNRLYHKKCFKEKWQMDKIKEMIERYKK